MADENTNTTETVTSKEVTIETPAGKTVETTDPKSETWKNGDPFNAEIAQSLIEKLRNSEKELAGKLTKLEQDQIDAKRKADEEQGKFQPLYEQTKADLDVKSEEAKNAAEKLQRANELLNADIEKRIKDWPDEAKALLPDGEGVDALERLEQVAKVEPLAKKLMDAPARPGNGSGPIASGGPADISQDGPRPAKYRM